jgi:hypothetical protein
VHDNEPGLLRCSCGQPEGAVFQVKRQSVNMLVAVGSPLVLEADGYVVKKAARWLQDRPKRSSNNDEKIKEERQYVLVLQRSSSGASLPASVVNCVSPLQHIDSLAAVKRRALSGCDELLHCCIVSCCVRLYMHAVHCTPTHL